MPVEWTMDKDKDQYPLKRDCMIVRTVLMLVVLVFSAAAFLFLSSSHLARKTEGYAVTTSSPAKGQTGCLVATTDPPGSPFSSE